MCVSLPLVDGLESRNAHMWQIYCWLVLWISLAHLAASPSLTLESDFHSVFWIKQKEVEECLEGCWSFVSFAEVLVCLINYCLIINPQGHNFHQWEENVMQTAKKYQIFHPSCFLIKWLHHEFKRAVQLHLGMVCLLFIPLMSSQAEPPLFLSFNRGFFGV